MKQWYEELFENYAKKYEEQVYIHGTLGECDFFEKELNFDKSKKILDIGCGIGRHTIELSKRGYNVTGIDLSDSLLNSAKEKAANLGLKTVFDKQDARKLTFSNEFDAAIMICEGAFSLMETDEMNYEILKNASKSLKENGKLIFTTLNGLFPLFHSVKEFLNSQANEESAQTQTSSFDLLTFRESNIISAEDDSGNVKELHCNERYYVPPEITWLLKSVGFKKIDIFGAKLGAFSRGDKLTPDDFEMLVVAEK